MESKFTEKIAADNRRQMRQVTIDPAELAALRAVVVAAKGVAQWLTGTGKAPHPFDAMELHEALGDLDRIKETKDG